MDRERYIQWLEQIYSTTETEIDCERLQALLPAYVDFELGGHHPADQLPAIRVHLAHCPDCAEEYRALRTVADLEAHDRLPQVEDSLARFPAVSVPEHAQETQAPTP